jgi:response regulator RpfG family c-di-GMP phosphodiesterase
MNHHPHIVVVCDTAGDKSVLQDVLADLAEVSFGNSGEQGIRNAQAWQPELMVVGVTLADMDGAQALGALKKDPRTAGIPVLLMVDRGDADAESRLLLQGATDVLHTPLRAEAVRSRIQLHLNLARHARQSHAFEQKDQHMQKASELLVDLLATTKLVANHVADGLPVEPLLDRWLVTGQQLKRTLASGRKAGAAPMQQDHAFAPAAVAAVQPPPSNTASPAAVPPASDKPKTPPPAAPPAGAPDENHLWLPMDPQDPSAR